METWKENREKIFYIWWCINWIMFNKKNVFAGIYSTLIIDSSIIDSILIAALSFFNHWFIYIYIYIDVWIRLQTRRENTIGSRRRRDVVVVVSGVA